MGRNFTSMVNILPGLAPVPGPMPDTLVQAWLIKAVDLLFMARGNATTTSPWTARTNVTPNFSRLGMIPPPEAINEMKVSSGMDSGAFGWASGANINVVTKSGSNQYHGDLWEFLRNSDLNARSYFIPKVGAYHYNQFGGAAGGPLMIPHILSKNRGWYVYGWYEGIRIHQAANNTALVPTAAQLNGDFSGGPAIYNPYSTSLRRTVPL